MSTTLTTRPKGLAVRSPPWDAEARWLAGGAAVCLGVLVLIVGGLFSASTRRSAPRAASS